MIMKKGFEPKWDKFGIRMSMEGEVKGSWLIHYSSPKIGFSCFDNEDNLVWVVKTSDEQDAIQVVNKERLKIIAMGLWGTRLNRKSGIDDYKFSIKLGDKRYDFQEKR